jgi:preprotein translocase SecF subunit
MKLLHIIPAGTKFRFVAKRKIAFLVSGLALLASLAFFFSTGLNFGIDFRGGTLMVISTEGPADLGKIRSLVSDLDLGDVQVQEFGSDHEVLIRVETQVARSVGESESIQQDVPVQIRAALDEGLSTPITVGLVEVVGPKVSGELVQSGALAVIAAVALMLVYIWFRFEWQFSLGAVIALVHDVILTIGVFSLTRIEFNLSIIAALLTIVGYSMNDTVVIYDRVRENLRKYKKMDLSELIDHSLNETLARTSMTSVTTLLALIALYVFGGEVIRGFTFAMMWGVVVGTYSSIFVAAPILLITGVKRDWSQSEEKHVGAPV